VTRLGEFSPFERLFALVLISKSHFCFTCWLLFSQNYYKPCNFDKIRLGIHFGWLFQKSIWSPCRKQRCPPFKVTRSFWEYRPTRSPTNFSAKRRTLLLWWKKSRAQIFANSVFFKNLNDRKNWPQSGHPASVIFVFPSLKCRFRAAVQLNVLIIV
jgi:hypothetical protein